MRAVLADPREGCDVEHAPDLASGLERLALHGIDVILLDLHLPESQGLDTLRRVQDAAPGTPVVVVTGTDDEELIDHALRHGAQDLVLKGRPHFVALLRHAVRHALERVQVLEALRHATRAPAATADPGVPLRPSPADLRATSA